MIKHVVSFKLKESDKRDIKSRQFCDALLKLPDKIDSLKSMEVGINCNKEESWHVVLIAVVDSFEALSNYANDPQHLEAVKIIKDIIQERACVDFEI